MLCAAFRQVYSGGAFQSRDVTWTCKPEYTGLCSCNKYSISGWQGATSLFTISLESPVIPRVSRDRSPPTHPPSSSPHPPLILLCPLPAQPATRAPPTSAPPRHGILWTRRPQTQVALAENDTAAAVEAVAGLPQAGLRRSLHAAGRLAYAMLHITCSRRAHTTRLTPLRRWQSPRSAGLQVGWHEL